MIDPMTALGGSSIGGAVSGGSWALTAIGDIKVLQTKLEFMREK